MSERRTRDIFLVANNVEELGGVQRVAHSLATMFVDRGHRVTVVGVQHAATPHDYGQRPYRYVVLNDDLPPPAPRVRGVTGRVDPRVRRDMWRHKRARNAAVDRLSAEFATANDGVVIVLQVYSMQWVEPAEHAHLRVIGMSHESFDAAVASHRYARIRTHYPDVDLFLLLTRHDADCFEREGFNNVGVMHNPLSFFPERTSDLDAKVIVAAGRYAPEKGYDRLIDAFAAVAPEHPDWSLRIFGHGPLQDELQDQVRRLGLEAQVELPGLAEDIEAELRAGSIFALSSIHEGLPMALAEAMACGVPCVAFDCAAGVREIITDGQDGIVVQPRNVPAFSAALRTLMDDRDLRHRLGAAARHSVRRFTPDAIAAEWEDVFALVER